MNCQLTEKKQNTKENQTTEAQKIKIEMNNLQFKARTKLVKAVISTAPIVMK